MREPEPGGRFGCSCCSRWRRVNCVPKGTKSVQSECASYGGTLDQLHTGLNKSSTLKAARRQCLDRHFSTKVWFEPPPSPYQLFTGIYLSAKRDTQTIFAFYWVLHETSDRFSHKELKEALCVHPLNIVFGVS